MKVLRHLDEAIRQGRSVEVRFALRQLSQKKIPRASLAEIARLCWRAGDAGLGLRVLHRHIRRSQKGIAPSPRECAEYGACLVRVGLVEEASELLGQISERETPEALLYAAFALIHRWEYAKSIALLERYVTLPGVNEYQQKVGALNLASALVFEGKHEQARSKLAELTSETSKQWKLLQAHALQTLAESAIARRDWDEAEDLLKRSRVLLIGSPQIYSFLVRKLESFIAIERDGFAASAMQAWQAVRREANQMGHWESVRDCDRALALSTASLGLAVHLSFGTPYPGFRDALKREFPIPLALPGDYSWTTGGDSETAPLVDISLGKMGSVELRSGGIAHRLLAALTSDFYRPATLATLYARMYPGDFYNPFSSPLRVHRALKDLRKAFQEFRVPLLVKETKGNYWLESSSPVKFVVRLESSLDRKELLVGELKSKLHDKTFTSVEASNVLHMSSRHTRRLLLEGLQNGTLEKSGHRRAAKYKFRE